MYAVWPTATFFFNMKIYLIYALNVNIYYKVLQGAKSYFALKLIDYMKYLNLNDTLLL